MCAKATKLIELKHLYRWLLQKINRFKPLNVLICVKLFVIIKMLVLLQY
jgi:hypothetical protein